LNIIVNVKTQILQISIDGKIEDEFQVATAKNGVGEQFGSECTPRGKHVIRAKIGRGARANSVFVARRLTGEIFSEKLREDNPGRDWILTRVLWLSGVELGFNRLKEVDTMRRFIYIHGCPDGDEMGVPSSHGCIKMHNSEIISLFDKVDIGTSVIIKEK